MASILAKKQKKKSNYTLKELKTLGHQLLSSRAHINNLPLLITFISPSSSPQFTLESLLSLQSFFIPVVSDLPSSKSLTNGGSDEEELSKNPELVYKLWLRSKFDDFVKSLVAVAVSLQSDETLRDVAFDAIMEFVKLGKGGRFQSVIYHRFLHAIVYSPSNIDILLDSPASKFLNFIDVQYFTYISLEKLVRSLDSTDIKDNNNISAHGQHILKSSNLELSIHKIHYILSRIPPFENKERQSDYELWSQLGISSKEIDEKQPQEVDQKNVENKHNNNVLVSLHQTVIPFLSSPIMLCDFLTRSYDIGGVISVMALSSLYILMTQHGLEYPNFYEKLYALLVPSIFMAKHRAKFLELLDSCLKSPLLPAYLAAAFTKKLSRLALAVPPSGSLVIIAIIHNLLRRHPSINFLVHQQTDENDTKSSRVDNECGESTNETDSCVGTFNRKEGIDMFNSEESDPAKSNAMRSSLWEIDTLRHHYCPSVSRFVASLENDLTIRAKTTEITIKDFSSASYATIFKAEMGRRVKQVPLAFYKSTPSLLFLESDFPGWTFKLDETKTVAVISGEAVDKSAKRQRND